MLWSTSKWTEQESYTSKFSCWTRSVDRLVLSQMCYVHSSSHETRYAYIQYFWYTRTTSGKHQIGNELHPSARTTKKQLWTSIVCPLPLWNPTYCGQTDRHIFTIRRSPPIIFFVIRQPRVPGPSFVLRFVTLLLSIKEGGNDNFWSVSVGVSLYPSSTSTTITNFSRNDIGKLRTELQLP